MKQRLIEQLRGGWNAESLALSVAMGAVIGVMPVFGVATLLCLLLSLRLRLNLPAIQAANYAVYPLQLALFALWLRGGELLFGLPELPFSPARLIVLFRRDALGALSACGDSLLAGLAVWGLAAPAACWLCYRIALPPLRRLAPARRP